MTKKESIKTHGGKREGSGRKPTGANPRILITLTPVQIETAKSLGNGNQSAGIRAALDIAISPSSPDYP